MRTLVALTICSACSDRGGCASERITVADVGERRLSYYARPRLDLLLVVDNSPSMEATQVRLGQALPAFVETLMQRSRAVPDLNIGTVTTSLGFSAPLANCAEPSDNGLLQNRCETVMTQPIVNIWRDEAGDLQNNTAATDVTVGLQCLASMGVEGCGIERPMEAAELAFDGRNIGLVRDDSHVAVLFVTDEDDCGVLRSNELAYATDLDFACFALGAQCSPDLTTNEYPRGDTQLSRCAPRRGSLREASVTADALRERFGARLLIGLLAQPLQDGNSVVVTNDGELRVGGACPELAHRPSVRMAELVDLAGPPSWIGSLCDDMGESLRGFADALYRETARHCLDGLLIDRVPELAGLQPDCDVRLTRDSRDYTLSVCADGTLPCYTIAPDPQCTNATGLALTVNFDAAAPPGPDERITADCRVYE